MATKKFYDPYLPVQRDRLSHPDGTPADKYSIRINDPEDGLVQVGTVSADYNLVTNEEVIQTAYKILEGADVLSSEPWKTTFDGKRFMASYIVNGGREVETPVLGTIVPTVDFQNSYNLDLRHGFAVNACRIQCWNGMCVSNIVGSFTFRHLGDSLRELEEASANLIAILSNTRFREVVAQFEHMAEVSYSPEEAGILLKSLPITDNLAGKIVRNLEGNSMWDIYNSITNLLTVSSTFGDRQRNAQLTSIFLQMVAAGNRYYEAA